MKKQEKEEASEDLEEESEDSDEEIEEDSEGSQQNIMVNFQNQINQPVIFSNIRPSLEKIIPTLEPSGAPAQQVGFRRVFSKQDEDDKDQNISYDAGVERDGEGIRPGAAYSIQDSYQSRGGEYDSSQQDNWGRATDRSPTRMIRESRPEPILRGQNRGPPPGVSLGMNQGTESNTDGGFGQSNNYESSEEKRSKEDRRKRMM